MARSIALILIFVALSNARLVWVDDNENQWNPFNPIKMIFPKFPKQPGFPQASGFPFGNLGLNIPLPAIPSPADIINASPKPGQVYNGVIAKSSSSYTTDKNGKPVRTGGTVVVTNNNGDVQKYETGSNPPNVNEPITFPPFFLKK